MPRVLEHLEPKAVFHFFEDLTRIPHGSRNTKAISDYCAAFARARGLWVYQDELNNVIIKKPASAGYEAAPAVILQGHLDMVAEKTPESPIDMTKDALALRVEGDGGALGRGRAVEEGEVGVGSEQGEIPLVRVRGDVGRVAHATASSISMPRAAARRVTDKRVRWSGALMAASSKEAVMNRRSASSGEMPRLAR